MAATAGYAASYDSLQGTVFELKAEPFWRSCGREGAALAVAAGRMYVLGSDLRFLNVCSPGNKYC